MTMNTFLKWNGRKSSGVKRVLKLSNISCFAKIVIILAILFSALGAQKLDASLTRTQWREISSLGGREGVLEDDWVTAISKPPGRRCIREVLAPTLCTTPTVIAKSFAGINPFELGAYILCPKAWNHHIYLPCQTWLHRVTILSLK